MPNFVNSHCKIKDDLFSLNIYHLIYIFPILLKRLIIGISKLHIGLITHFHFLAPFRQIFYNGARCWWYNGIPAAGFFIVCTAIVIIICCLIHDNGLCVLG